MSNDITKLRKLNEWEKTILVEALNSLLTRPLISSSTRIGAEIMRDSMVDNFFWASGGAV